MMSKRILQVLLAVVSALVVVLSFQNCGMKLHGGNGEGVESMTAGGSDIAPPAGIGSMLYYYSDKLCMDETAESIIISDGTRFSSLRTGCADHEPTEIEASLIQFEDGDHTILTYKKKIYRR